MDRGFFIIDDKYVIEVGAAAELMDGILASVLTLTDSIDGGVLAALLAEEVEQAEGTRPQIQRFDRSMDYRPYRVVEIDTTTLTVFDQSDVLSFEDYV